MDRKYKCMILCVTCAGFAALRTCVTRKVRDCPLSVRCVICVGAQRDDNEHFVQISFNSARPPAVAAPARSRSGAAGSQQH